MTDSLFTDADVISSYSRAEAINDGVLVDVTSTSREAGIRYPTALTRAAWTDLVEWDEARDGRHQDEAGRLWDVLWMSRWYSKMARPDMDRVTREIRRVPKGKRAQRIAHFVVVCGPGDDGSPVITIMLPSES